LIGLIYGIGVFGITPFLTALVYLRNSSRALKAQTGGAAEAPTCLSRHWGFCSRLACPCC
jgi:hypothetical protein